MSNPFQVTQNIQQFHAGMTSGPSVGTFGGFNPGWAQQTEAYIQFLQAQAPKKPSPAPAKKS
jgi:hypothetical protein